jgi:hypothetical protein
MRVPCRKRTETHKDMALTSFRECSEKEQEGETGYAANLANIQAGSK